MNILLLGGNSIRHKQWVRDLAAVLSKTSHNVQYVDYLHWDAGGEFADIVTEIDRAAVRASSMPHYMIIAKSVGTGIALEGIYKRALRPERCIFLGFPLKGIQADKEFHYTEALSLLPPTVFVQNENDPWGSATEVISFVRAHGNDAATFVTTPGDTHDYTDFSAIASLVE